MRNANIKHGYVNLESNNFAYTFSGVAVNMTTVVNFPNDAIIRNIFPAMRVQENGGVSIKDLTPDQFQLYIKRGVNFNLVTQNAPTLSNQVGVLSSQPGLGRLAPQGQVYPLIDPWSEESLREIAFQFRFNTANELGVPWADGTLCNLYADISIKYESVKP